MPWTMTLGYGAEEDLDALNWRHPVDCDGCEDCQ